MRLAAIDIGTNSVKLLVADVDSGAITDNVFEHAVTTGLGEGAGAAGRLLPVPMERTAEQVVNFARQARELGAEELRMAGTAALRNAADANALEFVAMVREATGCTVEILSGQQELELSRTATMSAFAYASPLVVVDIGGGSTELTIMIDGEIRDSRSMDIGARSLTDQVGLVPPVPLQRLDEAGLLIMETFSISDDMELEKDVIFTKKTKVILQGGTAYCVARLVSGLSGDNLHGTVVSLGKLGKLMCEFQEAEVNVIRERMPFDPGRAEVMVAGMLLIERIMGQVGVDRFTFSNYSLRHGMVLAERW